MEKRKNICYNIYHINLEGFKMNKYKRMDIMKRAICLILAVGMVATAFMSLLGYFL